MICSIRFHSYHINVSTMGIRVMESRLSVYELSFLSGISVDAGGHVTAVRKFVGTKPGILSQNNVFQTLM